MQRAAPVRRWYSLAGFRASPPRRGCNARRYYWGSVGLLLGVSCGVRPACRAILGLMTHLRHRAIAAFMSLGAGVLLSAASFKVAFEALICTARAATTGCRTTLMLTRQGPLSVQDIGVAVGIDEFEDRLALE